MSRQIIQTLPRAYLNAQKPPPPPQPAPARPTCRRSSNHPQLWHHPLLGIQQQQLWARHQQLLCQLFMAPRNSLQRLADSCCSQTQPAAARPAPRLAVQGARCRRWRGCGRRSRSAHGSFQPAVGVLGRRAAPLARAVKVDEAAIRAAAAVPIRCTARWAHR